MAITRIVPPIDFLHTASVSSLQSFELTRLNHAANLRREISALIDQWIQETCEALLARWMLEHHNSLHSQTVTPSELLRTIQQPSADPFPDIPQASTDIRALESSFPGIKGPIIGLNGGKPHK